MLRETPTAIYLKDYQPPDYVVDEVALSVELGEEHTLVQSRLSVRANYDYASGVRPLVLDGQDMELRTLAIDGTALPAEGYRVEPERLTVAQPPQRFILEIETRIRPQDNTALEGLYKSGNMFCTQCEAEGFRRITYFIDRPDVMARYSCTISADRARYPVLLSNGNPVARGDADGGRHWVRWEDPFRKPSYLFALVAGDLACVADRYTTASGREVAIEFYVEHANRDRCQHAVDSLKHAMAWDERVYGLEYDLDIYMVVAVGDFNMGAMENKGLNIFNTAYVLARPETATDSDYQGIEGVIGHEYFHNWTGNRVTCRDWFQLSLKEGLTVFRDQEFSADMTARAVKRIHDVRVLRSAQFPEDAGPMAHPVRPESYIEINNFYTSTVYRKGAEVVRMQHTLLGADGFRRGMDLYFQRHDGQAVTTDDFVAAMEDANAVDLKQFRRWYSQAGTPQLRVRGAYDPAARRYTLTVAQSCTATAGQPDKLPFHIPLALGLLDERGRDIPLRLAGEAQSGGGTRVLDVRDAQQQFIFEDVPSRPVPSLLRGFSAPVTIDAGLSDAELMFLFAHDSDAYNRWEAGQQLAARIILRLVEDRRGGRALVLDPGFVDAFGRTLNDPRLEPALIAEALVLPGEAYLGEQMAVVDVDGIHASREFVMRELARALRESLEQRYRTLASDAPYRPDAASVGRRSLRNLCLRYLAQLDEPAEYARCLDQFHAADNMTDALAALGALSHLDCPQRREALAAFHARWRQDALVMDKWFALQAGSRLPNTLAEVRGLLAHPAFDIRNPNKVRALIGSFSHGNTARFHDAGGAGYAFLAEQVLKLNAVNPQIAARLVSAFNRWRKFDPARQALMRAQLEKLAAADLSRDVYEIVSRALAVPA